MQEGDTIENTVYADLCDRLNLLPSSDLKTDLERDEDSVGIILVPDLIPASRETELLSDYPEGRIRLIGGLWFHLSVYFNVQLPFEWFEPSRQRNSLDEEQSTTAKDEEATNKKSSKKEPSITGCVKRLLIEFISQQQSSLGNPMGSLDWAAIHKATYASLTEGRAARREAEEKRRQAHEQREERKIGQKTTTAMKAQYNEVEEGQLDEQAKNHEAITEAKEAPQANKRQKTEDEGDKQQKENDE